ncbi:MAG: DUF971 domain-containing protein [Phycisphaerales bacterium]|nr:MAG: DUF971 domain-containing protein [Phycisphaerales bacterium]
MPLEPVHLDLQKDRGLTIRWADGTTSFYPIDYLRRHSPAADNRRLQEEMASNPLTVLPSGMARHEGPITAENAEFVGNYAVRIFFSDGHCAGLYTWEYLRQIDPKPGSEADCRSSE